jgi:hypothetical protein
MRPRLQRLASHVLSTAALAAIFAWPVAAQRVRGNVLEEFTDRPIDAASVFLLTPEGARVAEGTTTDRGGAFTLTAPSPGTYRLYASRPGYRLLFTPAIQLRQGDEIAVTLRLLPDTITLRPIVVTASNRRAAGRLGGFYDRMQRRAGGVFITREQIEQRHPFEVSDLLRTVPGLTVVPSRYGFGYDVRSTTGCRPQVYLDGVPYTLLGDESIDHIVSPHQLEGIEVYPHPATTPVEFQMGGNATCGAIVLWTRT